ncbi:MAG: hypothetical protein EOM59_19040 [Clostridia bacterium]|nr:hypothetical protein [Clostridia bacterium]
MPRGNRANLDPVKSNEEARKRGSNGGVKSGETRRKQKTMREVLNACLALPFKSDDTDEITEFIKKTGGKNIDCHYAGVLAQVYKYTKGDNGSAVFVRDTKGEKPVDKQEVNGTLTLQRWEDIAAHADK